MPIAVYNNVKGKDRVILNRYKEPTWNNPVVRFVTPAEKDIIPRQDRVWTTAGLLQRMVLALKADRREAPEYLQLVAAEYNPARREKAVFAMYCYWEGEKRLGRLDGVLATRIGSLERCEVVEVEFDPTVVSFEKLVQQAKQLKCTSRVFTRSAAQQDLASKVVGKQAVRIDKPINAKTTQQYHLAHKPAYHYLPMTALQATKVNAAIADGQSPDRFLSPGQLTLQKRIAARLAKNRKALAGLKPDRTPAGLVKYAGELKKLLEE